MRLDEMDGRIGAVENDVAIVKQRIVQCMREGDREPGSHRPLVKLSLPPRIDPRIVDERLGLTPGESRVAAIMAEGRSVHEIAADVSRAVETIRWLVRQIHSKLDLTRLAQLVRAVLLAVCGKGWASEAGWQTPVQSACQSEGYDPHAVRGNSAVIG